MSKITPKTTFGIVFALGRLVEATDCPESVHFALEIHLEEAMDSLVWA